MTLIQEVLDHSNEHYSQNCKKQSIPTSMSSSNFIIEQQRKSSKAKNKASPLCRKMLKRSSNGYCSTEIIVGQISTKSKWKTVKIKQMAVWKFKFSYMTFRLVMLVSERGICPVS